MKMPRSLRGRMIGVTAAMLLIIGSATLYTSFATAELAKSLGLLFRRNRLIEDIRSSLVLSARSLEGYLGSGSEANRTAFERNSALLADSTKSLNRAPRPDESSLLQKELAGLVDRYLADSAAAIRAKRGRYISTYTALFESSERSAELCRFLIERIERMNLTASIDAYTGLSSRIKAMIATNAALLLAALLTAFLVFVRYAWAVTESLTTLSGAARAIAGGDYDRRLPPLDAAEEISTMAAAFENMRASVRRSFQEQREKAEIERRLITEELRLVELDRKLKDAELLALQSQINPHFLYNTLAAGLQLALAEGAERTSDFMEQLSLFIRYALRPMARSVSVAEEFECAQRYVWLLRLRFGERYSFELEADPSALDAVTPALVLQPLVENAITHGLRDRESGGIVRVHAHPDGTVLEVSDNGRGMEAGEIERVLAAAEADVPSGDRSGEPGGIGLHNVVRRVLLSTGGRGRVEIESTPGRGTLVRIILPRDGEGA